MCEGWVVGTINWSAQFMLFTLVPLTTVINGLGVVGWGVGGIEAEAVMLNQAVSMVRCNTKCFVVSVWLARS
jgi:hypothetical protein